MLRTIYYSIRNIVLYRKVRPIPTGRFVEDMYKTTDVGRTLTDCMLRGVGLKVVDDHDQLGRVYLTRKQRKIIELVRQFGYKVGLS